MPALIAEKIAVRYRFWTARKLRSALLRGSGKTAAASGKRRESRNFGKSKWGLSNGGLRPLSAMCGQSSAIVHFSGLFGPLFSGELSSQNDDNRRQSFVGNCVRCAILSHIFKLVFSWLFGPPKSPRITRSSACALCGPFGPLSKGNFRHKMTTIVGDRGQLWTSTFLDFPDNFGALRC